MARRTHKNVGVIGLGIIGRRVADCVRRAGFSTFVWNRTPRPFPNFVGSPAEIAELCDFIQIFVSDDEALLQVVQRMKQSLGSHHIILAHSTVAPATTRAAAEMVQRRGAQLLDAPFTGSKLAAEKGELVYYIGGDEAAYRRARPVLEASSKEIIEIGEIGQATTIKIATNMITAATVQVAAEALALVHNAGLPLEKFAEAMQGNGSNSGTLKMKLPKMMQGDFEPHFSVKHMLKDVEIASRMARGYGLALPATEAARDSLLEEARRGRTDDDYSSIARIFFPDGPPGKAIPKSGEEEEQSVLSGLDERPTATVRSPEPEHLERLPAALVERTEEPARNGHLAAEIPAEAKPREEPVAVKEVAIAEKREEPVEEKRVEALVEKIDEPEKEKPAETVSEKPTEPESEKRDEAIDKDAETTQEKPAAPVEAKLEESVPEKHEEPVIEKREEVVDEKREEPVVEKSAEVVGEKREEVVKEKLEESISEKPAVAEKIEEPIAEKRDEPQPEKKDEEVAVKPEPKPSEPVVVARKVEEVVTESANGEEEEIPEPRRSFLSRLFGKSGDY